MSVSFFHRVVNGTETAWGRAGGILGRKSLAPVGEMKVSIVPGEITTLLSCRLQLERTAKPRRKKISRPKPQTIGGRDNYNCKLKPSRSGAIFFLTQNNLRDTISAKSGFWIQVCVVPRAKFAFQTSCIEQ